MPTNASQLFQELSRQTLRLLAILSSRMETLEQLSSKVHQEAVDFHQHHVFIQEAVTSSDQARILEATSPESIAALFEELDVAGELCTIYRQDMSLEDLWGSVALHTEIERTGKRIDELRAALLLSPPTPTPALAHVAALLRPFELIVVAALTKRPLAERLRERKHWIKWLKTPAGRRYLHRKAQRRKLNLRKDPERSRLMKQVARMYR